jgi:hypothetical protein
MNKRYNNRIKDIIEGYKGIMDLDLTNVQEGLKKQLAEQHMKDIDNYKAEQAKLKPQLRYENTVERIQKIHAMDEKQQQIRSKIQMEERRKYNELYNSR